GIIEKSNELNEQLQNFEQNDQKSILIIIVDGRINQQRIHIPFIRQLIDKSDLSCNKSTETLGEHLVSKILAKILGTEMLVDLENLGTR
ncbi:unnamed protein product, partial [Rotaria sordida]